MDVLLGPAAQLGGTVFVTMAFLWYLTRRDKEIAIVIDRAANTNLKMAKSLQKLTDMIEKNIVTINNNSKTIDKNSEIVSQNTDGKS